MPKETKPGADISEKNPRWTLSEASRVTKESKQYILLLIERYNLISPERDDQYRLTEKDVVMIHRYKLLRKGFHFSVEEAVTLAHGWEDCVAISDQTSCGLPAFVAQQNTRKGVVFEQQPDPDAIRTYYGLLSYPPIFTEKERNLYVAVQTQTPFALELFAEDNKISRTEAASRFHDTQQKMEKTRSLYEWISVNKHLTHYFSP